MRPSESLMYGKISASMTHEMRNVLATIREAADLMDDLLKLDQDQAHPHRDKYLRAVGVIQKQVKRGVEISTNFNKFAHTTDEPRAVVEIGEMLSLAANLMKRLAGLKELTLRVEESEPGLSLTIDPFRLVLTLACGLECCFALGSPAGAISLRARQEDRRLAVFIEVDRPAGEFPTDQRLGVLRELLGLVGGDFESFLGEQAAGVKLVLPLEPQ
ncbi:MAG: hypothetical protein AB1896_06015 [Thermodesulfobacteriota bacterium]